MTRSDIALRRDIALARADEARRRARCPRTARAYDWACGALDSLAGWEIESLVIQLATALDRGTEISEEDMRAVSALCWR